MGRIYSSITAEGYAKGQYVTTAMHLRGHSSDGAAPMLGAPDMAADLLAGQCGRFNPTVVLAGLLWSRA